MKTPCKVALLGAECTGKSSLTTLLGLRLADLDVATVGEYLREWCLASGRTPRREEQAPIAAEQSRRIAAAAQNHRLVVADTTALMTALYSIHYFEDATALPDAVRAQQAFDLTLLCCPEGIPWQADGWLRESPAVRRQAHEALVALLQAQGLPFTVLSGPLDERAALAEMLIRSLPTLRRPHPAWAAERARG
ncbi:AAA family ATPase [Inhella proteolytica]|uniref:ATP-binding protein n=1 Tax=Inhella proteolytica TaxID=2795029 RepID=A0A931IXD6_9BURK|nr:ATP-binding protein [Inhella proteolytica]MBH9575484.1 ATP-binding protein [Inhella proteolytica]